MGLLGAIKKAVTTTWAVLSCYSSKSPEVRGKARDVHTGVVDHLTKFRTMEDVESYTLPLLADNLVAQIKEPTTILCCDDRLRVPKLKADTQAARVDAVVKASAKRGIAEAIPYPRGAKWDFGTGWVSWTEKELDPHDNTRLVDAPKLEPINLPRLSKSRWYGSPDDPNGHSNLGNELWATMHERLQQYVSMSNLCRQVFFDYTHTGPFIFDKSDKSSGQMGKSMDHNLGEADTAMIWWAAQFDGKTDHIHLRTCDSDQMAIYLLWHATRSAESRARTRIWWHCDKDQVIDLGQMTERILSRDFLLLNGQTRRFPSARHVGLFFILCGTDFFSQRVVAFGNGLDKMLQGFLMIDWQAASLQFGESDWFAPSLDKPAPFLDYVLREWIVRMYHYKLPGGKTQVPEKFRKPPPPLVSMDSIRRRHREKEESAFDAMCLKQRTEYETMVGEQNRQVKELKDSYRAEIIDHSTEKEVIRAQFEKDRKDLLVRYVRKLDELADDQFKARENMWRFPDEDAIHWASLVLAWNYKYWLSAASGIAVPEPVKPQASAPAAAG